MSNGTYIERIEISSFGKLKNVVITPSLGINVLTLPNEAGKSTLADFIKFIFYGFGGSRKSTISENEKAKYMPWDGSRASGNITITTPDGRFRIERTTNGTKESADIYDAYTRKPVLIGMVPGEVFFGVGEESFGKILFFKQLFQQKNGDASLAEQIQNLIFSADEKTNTEKAVKRLKELRACLKNNQKKGKIPELESKLEEYETRLSESLEIKQQLDNVIVSAEERKNRIQFNEKKLSVLEAEEENIRKYESKKKLDSLRLLAKKKQEAEENYNRCLSEFKGEDIPDTDMVHDLISDNASLTLAEKAVHDTENEIKVETKRLELLKDANPFFFDDLKTSEKSLKKTNLFRIVIFAIGVLLALAAAGIVIVKGINTVFYVLCACASVFIISGFTLALKTPPVISRLGLSSKAEFMRLANEYPAEKAKADEKEKKILSLESSLRQSREDYKSLKASIDKRIGKYMNETDGAYGITIQKLMNNSIEAGNYKAELISLEGQLEAELEGVDLEKLKEEAKDAVLPEHDIETVKRQSDFYKSAINATKIQLNELEKQRASLEAKTQPPSVLCGKRDAVKKKLDSYRIKYDALSLALEVIEESGDYMKSTVSPKIAQLSSAYLAKATNDRYPEISLTTDLSVSVSTECGEKSIDYLSSGAKDTAYMCLRCGLTELLYENKKPFMILDDAFSRLDDKRLENMLKVLVELSSDQQIIILTCHNRESFILNKLTNKVNILELEK